MLALARVWLLPLLVGNACAESVSPAMFTQAEVVIPGQASCYKTPQPWSELFPETVQPPPASNEELQDIVIEATQSVILDQSMAVRDIFVFGCLVIDCELPSTLTIHAHNIDVQGGGFFRAGEPQKACGRKVNIDLYEAGEIRTHPQSFLGLRGQWQKTWTQLTQTAMYGDTAIVVESEGGWAVGDQIAIATTDWNRKHTKNKNTGPEDHTELRTITAINKKTKTVSFDEPLEFKHYGELQYVPQWDTGPKVLDERAEVAILSRSIRVRGIQCLQDKDRELCATTRFLKYSVVELKYTEFRSMGHTFFPIGNYPIHFHNFGDADGKDPEFSGPWPSSVIGCLVRDSNSRGIVLHGATRMMVKLNVLFDIEREGYFLEDGFEEFNIFENNLAINIGRAAFWMTNMNNVLVKNHIVNAEQGFMFNTAGALVNDMKCPYPGTSREDYCFWGGATTFGRVEGNTAHVCKEGAFRHWRKVGVTTNCYCTPLPAGWTAEEFYGRKEVSQCSYSDCQKAKVGQNLYLTENKKSRAGYAVYKNFTFFHNGWEDNHGGEYNPWTHIFPGMIVADQCAFIKVTSLNGQGPMIFSDITYVRQTHNVMEGKNGELWPFTNCEGTFNKFHAGVPGPNPFKFNKKHGGRATSIRGCVFDRIVILGADHIATGLCNNERMYIQNDLGNGPYAYLNEADVPVIATGPDFAPFPLLGTKIEDPGTGFFKSGQVGVGYSISNYLPNLDDDWLEPLRELGYTYKDWSELPGWTLVLKQTLPGKLENYKFNVGNPSDNNYVKLNNLHEYKGNDGLFTFMLKWPGLHDGQDVVQIWKQDGNPMGGCFVGYTRDIVRVIAGSKNMPNDYMHWGTGLGRCSDECLLSKGSTPDSTEFCVGLTNASEEEELPILKPSWKDSGEIAAEYLYANEVELYVLKDGADPRVYDMAGFTKVFEHRVGKGGGWEMQGTNKWFFSSLQDAVHKELTQNFVQAGGNNYYKQFSMLDLLEGFRDKDGFLEFKIVYSAVRTPAVGSQFPYHPVEWFRQDTNPLEVMPGGCPDTFESMEGIETKKAGACGLGRNKDFTSLLSLNTNTHSSSATLLIGQPTSKSPATFAGAGLRYRLGEEGDVSTARGVEVYVRSKFDTEDPCSFCLNGFRSCSEKCLILHGKAGTCVGETSDSSACCECSDPGQTAISSSTTQKILESLLINGSFEDDEIPENPGKAADFPPSLPWVSDGNVNFWGLNFGPNGLVSIHGEKLVGVSGGSTLSQTVGTKHGTIYRLSLYVRALKGVPTSGYRVKANDKTLLGPKMFVTTNKNIDTKVYKLLSMNFVADSDETTISIKNIQEDEKSVLIVDDITLVEMETVPIYEFFSATKLDYTYNTLPEAPEGYVANGHVFSLHADGDFTGSVPLYSSIRLEGNGVNEDGTLSTKASLGVSAEPFYLTTNILGYCYWSGDKEVNTIPLTRYKRSTGGLDNAVLSSSVTPDTIEFSGVEYENMGTLCRTPLAMDDGVPDFDTTPIVPSPSEDSPNSDDDVYDGPEEDVDNSIPYLDEDEYDSDDESVWPATPCEYSGLGYACSMTLTLFPKVTMHWTVGGGPLVMDTFLGVGPSEIEIALEAEVDGMVAFAFAGFYGSMDPASAIVGWSDTSGGTVKVYEISSKPSPVVEGDDVPFEEVDIDIALKSYGVWEETIDGKTVTTLKARIDIDTTNMDNVVALDEVMFVNWAVSSQDKLAFHDISMGFLGVHFDVGAPTEVAPDPFCSVGVLSSNSAFCCPSTCNSCTACTADVEDTNCCTNLIPIDKFCSQYASPCAIESNVYPGAGDLVVHPTNIAVPADQFFNIESPVVLAGGAWPSVYLDAPSSLDVPLGKVEYAFEASEDGALSFSVFAKCNTSKQNSWFLSTDSTIEPTLIAFPVSSSFQWFTFPDSVGSDANAGDIVIVELGGRELNCEIGSVMLSTVKNAPPGSEIWDCDSNFLNGLGDTCTGCSILCGTDASDIIYSSNSAGCNCIFAGAGNDVVVAGSGDTVYGSTGDDTIHCTSGDDDSSACILFGEAGKDTLISSQSESVLYGGMGADTLYSESGTANKWLYPGFGADVIYGGESDFYQLGKGSNTLYVDTNQCTSLNLEAQSDADTIYLWKDDPQLCSDNVLLSQYSELCHQLCPCTACTLIEVTVGALAITGTDGCDCIVGDMHANTIYGLGGSDVILGMGGDDVLHGGEGSDTIYGGAGNDKLFGNQGSDTLYGNAGEDSLFGGLGGDFLLGGKQKDVLRSGPGKDTLKGGPGADKLFGCDGDIAIELEQNLDEPKCDFDCDELGTDTCTWFIP